MPAIIHKGTGRSRNVSKEELEVILGNSLTRNIYHVAPAAKVPEEIQQMQDEQNKNTNDNQDEATVDANKGGKRRGNPKK